MTSTTPHLPDPAGAGSDADRARFRQAMGRFATGVTVLTTVADGHDHAMTANSVTSVSLEPLLVLACVELEARFHDAVIEAGVWGLNVLPGGARPTAAWLATRGRPLHGQLDRVPHRRGPATGVALLDGAIATLECRTRDVHRSGDHDILVADVLSVDLDPADADALVYWRGEYHRIS
ncbi:flavin reductase family protein [Agilicoccus flavus]|uniref:flavin reductase family protein n=1 Tax=Agilicoccus flavus TaxID=2775968 RepID=UPI001CF61C65|nr:flavin reductase family protein [Agilicoccus flavus]